MKRIGMLAVLAAGCCWPQAGNFFPLDQVRPGMHGVGKTVFQGDRIEDFQAEILGVMPSGPKQSIVLARLSGGPLAEAGVIQGMSGSPVYIDGKLLGAVAFGFAYAKEPIAGIQPIGQMMATSTFDAPRARKLPAVRFEPGHGFSLDLPANTASADNLTQILTPLSMAGFTARTIRTFAPWFRQIGFQPEEGVAGGGASSLSAPSSNRPLRPGDMISVDLMTGDLAMGADGTVTYVDGKRVYAFGHRFLDSGPTELPFARSEVLAVLPNLNTSFKLSRPGEWLGTILSDRSTAVAGEIGRPSHTVPVSITLHSAETGTHSYHLQLANDLLLTPLLAQAAVFSCIDASERTLGSGTMRLHTYVEFENNLPPLDLRDIFVSDSALPLQVASDAVVTLAFVLSAGFEQVHVKRISFDLESLPAKHQLYINQAWTSSHEVRPGDTVTITALFGGANGKQLMREAQYKVPLGAPAGQLNFTVSDANTQNFPEFAGMNAASAKTPADLIGLINRYRGAESAYVRVWRAEPAFTISGPRPDGEITDPPPSVMLILADPSESPTANPALTATRGSGVAELRIPVDGYVVTGARTVQVEVKP